VAVRMCALIRPGTGPEPYCAAIAAATASVAAANAAVPWASISFRIGVRESAQRLALPRDSLAARRPEPSGQELRLQCRSIVMSMRRARQEHRRIRREQRGNCLHHGVGELIRLDAIPDAEQEAPTRLQDTECLDQCPGSIREEHTPNWHSTASNMPWANGSR
jgi:hypothetical protein